MKIAIVIPARYQSSRFPGKPIAMINGAPMIDWVYRQCVQSSVDSNEIYIATDDFRIAKVCLHHHIKHVLTSKKCRTGTDRVYEANKKIKADVVVSVQGDEPLIHPAAINCMLDRAEKAPPTIFNAMCPIEDQSDITNVNVPKVVFTPSPKQLLYASRAPIPLTKEGFYPAMWRQVGLYAFPNIALHSFGRTPAKTPLEAIEDIEILRFLELGYPVTMVHVLNSGPAVDVPDDILRVEKLLQDRNNQPR